MLPLNDVLSSRMKTSSHDGPNLAKSNPRRTELLHRREAPLATRTDLTPEATKDISGAMNAILADVFALYLKTKNFHWHMSGHHFRDYHLLLDEHAEQLFAMTDVIAVVDSHTEGEPTRVVIGHDNILREYVTVNRGTVPGGGVTTTLRPMRCASVNNCWKVAGTGLSAMFPKLAL